MSNPPKRQKSTAYSEALKLVLEEGFYVLQRRSTPAGYWSRVGERIKGRPAALETLNKVKKGSNPSNRWRVVQEVEAQAYAEGWKAREELESQQGKESQSVDAGQGSTRAVGAGRR